MRDLFLVSMKQNGSWYPIIAFEDIVKVTMYIEEHPDNEYKVELIYFDPTY